MNIERGVRRIALILSLVAGIGAWYSVSREKFDRWDVMCYHRQDYLAKKKIIEFLWGVWDSGGFEEDQGRKINKREVIEHLLTDWSRNEFEIEGKRVWISASDFFPGVSERMLSMTPAQLDVVAQAAKVDACFIAEPESSLVNWSRPVLMGLGIACGLPSGLGGFLGVWLSFFLLRWIGRGFVAAPGQAAEIGESDGLVLSSPNQASGEEERKSSACDTQVDAAKEAEGQAINVG